MKQKNRYLFSKLLAIAAAALVFGCAPPSPNAATADRSAALKALGGSSSAALIASAGWKCPGAANVNLKDNITLTGYDFTGMDDYKVCTSTTTTASYKVTGSTDSSSLCFYPMNQPANGAPQIVGTPQCYAVSGSPILPVFTNVTGTINYMVVVDANYTTAMNACLSSASPCPAHSEGPVQ